MNVCEKNKKTPIPILNTGNRQYIIDQIQKHEDYKTVLQENEYNLQMQNYIKEIMNIQKQNPKKSFSKIVNEYIENI